MPSSA